jgi:hypothetical protein
MSIKWTPAVILYIVALVLFVLSAIASGGQVQGIGMQGLGLASLAAGLIVDRWER